MGSSKEIQRIGITVILMVMGFILLVIGGFFLSYSNEPVYFIPVFIGAGCMGSFPLSLGKMIADGRERMGLPRYRWDGVVLLVVVLVLSTITIVFGLNAWTINSRYDILSAYQDRSPPYVKEFPFTIDKYEGTPVYISLDVSDRNNWCPSTARVDVDAVLMAEHVVIANWSFHETSSVCHVITNVDQTEDVWTSVQGRWDFMIENASIGDSYTFEIDMQYGNSMDLYIVYDHPELEKSNTYILAAASSGLGILFSLIIGGIVCVVLDKREFGGLKNI